MLRGGGAKRVAVWRPERSRQAPRASHPRPARPSQLGADDAWLDGCQGRAGLNSSRPTRPIQGKKHVDARPIPQALRTLRACLRAAEEPWMERVPLDKLEKWVTALEQRECRQCRPE